MSTRQQKSGKANMKIPNNEDPFQEQVEKILALLGAQSRGENCSAEIEETLSALVPKSTTTNTISIAPPSASNEPVIEPDTTNYDTLEEDSKELETKACHFKKGKATMESLRQQESHMLVENNGTHKFMSENWKTLDDIPLGNVGAKMMVTFGDGHNPKPEAVAAVLMGARTCLQYAIKDARALRRKQKHEFLKARMATALHTKKDDKGKLSFSEANIHDVDPTMVFRAVSGYDPLSYDSKVGFDVTQLDVLFPEEMNAYKRWEKMRHDYEVSSKKADDAKGEDEGDDAELDEGNVKDADEEPINSSKTDEEEEWSGGHLRGRMAQFDARTARMKEDWYMQFAEVRQGGSFLSSRTKTREDKQWNEEKKRRMSRGRVRGTTSWESLNSLSVQFLHWLGFDLSSSLPPPNEETTQALAFLGHDFLGKIVEKAILLRLQKKKSDVDKSSDNGTIDQILELAEGEQLEAEDIERALNDTSINSMPLYCAANSVLKPTSAGHALQLYFGPGFEDRLEMELDQ